MATPKSLLNILDSVTMPQIAVPQALGVSMKNLYARVRTIFEDDNIVGAGIAEKISGEERTDELGIVFYVREKLPAPDLNPESLLPPVLAAANGRAVFTDVVEIGDVVPQINIQDTPIQSGYSVGYKDLATGTLGAIVRRRAKRFLLSNSHVFADAGLGTIGDPIIFPGSDDGGVNPSNLVARLTTFTPFVVGQSFTNLADAALAELETLERTNLDLSILDAATPLKVGTPQRGMAVSKRGRTTGDTTSTVRDVDFRILVRYDGVGVVGFTGQVLCDNYTAGGDSGSIVVAKDTGAIVGLHFAGSENGSVFTPIRTVMNVLKFRF